MRMSRWVVAPVAAVVLAGGLSQSAQAVGLPTAVDTVSSSTTSGATSSAASGAAAQAVPARSPRGDVAATPKGPRWWGMFKRGGKQLDVTRLSRGSHADEPLFRMVIGTRYVLQGRLPARYRDTLAGTQLRVEAKSDTDTAWTTVASFTADGDGRFKAGVRLTRDLLGVHDYRIKASSAARASTVLPGGTLTAVADSSFTLIFANNTKTDLVFTFPTWQDPVTGRYAEGDVTVPQGASQVLEYINPIQNATTVGFYAQRLQCFMGCSTYNANWDHAPNKKYTPCNTAPPTFTSGGAYTVRITPQFGSSGFDMFLVDGSGNVVCTGALSTKFSQWMGNHPIAKWAAIYLAADATINVVGTLIAAFAGEAIAAAVAAAFADEVTADSVIDVFENDNRVYCIATNTWNPKCIE